jgi:hypothetical protein
MTIHFKLRYLTLSAILLSGSAYSMRFSATINRLKLPLVISTEQPPQIKYVPPGNLNVTAHRMCGDGDVAHFASVHPEFDFVPSDQAQLDVMIGYWVVEDGAIDISPSATNWYPMAYKKINIASSQANMDQNGGRFLPFTHAPIGAGVNGMLVARSELVNLYNVAKESFNVTKNYRVFAAALACVDPNESGEIVAEGSGTYTPSPVDTIGSLSGISAAAESVMSSSAPLNQILNTNKKIKIDGKTATSPQPYAYSFGNQGADLPLKLYSLFEAIMNTSYPATAANVDEYKAALDGSNYKTTVSAHTGDKINFCNDVGADSSKTAKHYDFEPFPLNMTCKYLYNGSDLQNAYTALFAPIEKPSLVEFENAQRNLAKRFLVAAGYEAAQKHLHKNAKVIRTGCFKKTGNGQNLIGRVVASYPFKFVVENGRFTLKANQHNHIHPENLFAISDFNNYFSHEILAIWGQVTPSQGSSDPNQLKNNGIYLPLSNPAQLDMYPVDNTSFSNVPLNINFKVRSVGGSCSGTIFC